MMRGELNVQAEKVESACKLLRAVITCIKLIMPFWKMQVICLMPKKVLARSLRRGSLYTQGACLCRSFHDTLLSFYD